MKKGREEFFGWERSSLAASVRKLARGGLATEPGSGFHYCTEDITIRKLIPKGLCRNDLRQPTPRETPAKSLYR
jgi:hypothetical protein